MESLLRWGITNSASSSDAPADAPPPAPRQDLDPAIIDAILGKPDAELMKEALTRARDESLDEDTRVEALDELEMVCTFVSLWVGSGVDFECSWLSLSIMPAVCF